MQITPYSGGNLLAICKHGEGNFAMLAAFPGFSKWSDRDLIFRPVACNIQYILDKWPQAEWIGDTRRYVEELRSAATLAAATVVAKEDKSEIVKWAEDYQFYRKPMSHQLKAFILSRERPTFGLFMEQGTGKTKVIIDNAVWLHAQGKIDMLIIVAWPNGVHRNWIDYELPVDMRPPYHANYWSGNNKAKFRRIDYRKLILRQDGVLKVMAFNIEAFVGEDAKEMLLEMLERHRCLFVIDQSASIKTPSSQRAKFLLKEAAPLAPYRRILDGAPVAEGAEELFAQFKFLDPNIIGHDTFTAFKAEFCKIGFFKQIEGYKNLDKLHAAIDGYCYRVLSSECQDLPKRTYRLWPFDLTSGEQRVFDELKVKELSFFEPVDLEQEGELDFTQPHLEEHLALVKNMRLQQISSGWWPEKDNFKPIDPKAAPSRLDALKLLLKAAPGKALIFARFRADLELIKDELGKDAVCYYGGVSDDERAEAKRKFMEDPKTIYFIGQPRSAGIGHTLTAARHVIFYSNDHSLRLREECEKRAHRTGLAHPLTIWDLVARGTHDSSILKAFRSKKQLSNEILKDPANFFLQHDQN